MTIANIVNIEDFYSVQQDFLMQSVKITTLYMYDLQECRIIKRSSNFIVIYCITWLERWYCLGYRTRRIQSFPCVKTGQMIQGRNTVCQWQSRLQNPLFWWTNLASFGPWPVLNRVRINLLQVQKLAMLVHIYLHHIPKDYRCIEMINYGSII